MSGPVVLGYDGSPESVAALPVAVDLARLHGTTLAVVFGYEPPRAGGEVGALRGEIAKVGEEVVAEATSRISELAPDLPVEVELVQDRPIAAVVRLADALDAAFVVVGHRQRSLLAEMFVGSVLEGVMAATTRPVVVVQAPEG